jgi:hypothetical protein
LNIQTSIKIHFLPKNLPMSAKITTFAADFDKKLADQVLKIQKDCSEKQSFFVSSSKGFKGSSISSTTSPTSLPLEQQLCCA